VATSLARGTHLLRATATDLLVLVAPVVAELGPAQRHHLAR
jgi:hypothetical protein